VPSKSPIGHAIGYGRSIRAALDRYLEMGLLAMNNHTAERTLRPVAAGRESGMFCGSDGLGRISAIRFRMNTISKGWGIVL
jgi:hypothetical protein